MTDNEQLLSNLKSGFSEDDLRTLCFELGIEYEDLPGSTREGKARELILYCKRHGRTDDLLNICAQKRPHLAWKTLNPITPSPEKPLPFSIVMRVYDEHVEQLKEYVRKSEYIDAVEYAMKCQEEFEKADIGAHLRFRLTRAEFDVWYAHALMYTGKPSEAIVRLEKVIKELENLGPQCEEKSLKMQWGIILGRAHNHIGYINWMDLGRYEVALREFKTAINYCALVETTDELATAYDNMGRVYAELGYFIRAKFLIERGRELRQDLPDIRRRDLSLVSSAIAHLANGEPNHALLITEKICNNKDRSQPDRIFGLTLLARARALRYLASPTYLRALDADLRRLDEAEKCLLQQALPIFKASGERIRLFQLYNELGCIKREKARLLQSQKKAEDAPKQISDAIEMLKYSLDYVKNPDGSLLYPAHFLDACIDLADTYILADDKKHAEEWLEEGEKALPQNYDWEQKMVESEDFFEDLWQQAGKAAALRGQIAFAKATLPVEPPKDKLPDDLKKAVEYYTFATGYFGRFLTRPIETGSEYLYPTYRPQLANHRLFIERLYDNLKSLSPEYWKLIEQEVTKLEQDYKIEHTWTQDFYGDTLNFLLQITGPK